jgi:hypothetical protein
MSADPVRNGPGEIRQSGGGREGGDANADALTWAEMMVRSIRRTLVPAPSQAGHTSTRPPSPWSSPATAHQVEEGDALGEEVCGGDEDEAVRGARAGERCNRRADERAKRRAGPNYRTSDARWKRVERGIARG